MERKHRWYTLNYEGITFTVQGDWEDFQAATETEPSEGGCFYEYEIFMDAFGHDTDRTEMFSEKYKDKLISIAEEGLRGMV